jgi:hypothetical protein
MSTSASPSSANTKTVSPVVTKPAASASPSATKEKEEEEEKNVGPQYGSVDFVSTVKSDIQGNGHCRWRRRVCSGELSVHL